MNTTHTPSPTFSTDPAGLAAAKLGHRSPGSLVLVLMARLTRDPQPGAESVSRSAHPCAYSSQCPTPR